MLLYDWRFNANQFVLASSPWRLTFRDILFQLNPYGHSPYVTTSIQDLCQYRLCKADHVYLTYLILQWQLSHLNGRKLDHRQV
jgi:hypothetical protein